MMRVHVLLLAIVLLFQVAPCQVDAAAPGKHFFDCKECHLSGRTITELGGENVCLKCHNLTAADVALNPGAPAVLDGHTDARFATGDASNAFGHGSGQLGAAQTSHSWYADSDVQPAAGADSPAQGSYPQFYSRFGTSVGKITCSRCHNPHGAAETNPKLLVMGADSADQMCLACHADWNLDSHGWLSHPIVANYNAVALAQPAKYRASLSNKGQGQIKLVNGGVSCTSCHAPHFTDSNAETSDGVSGTPGSSPDGKLLCGDGPGRPDKSSLCQTCHLYQEHGDSSGEKVGCLVCHSGHSYDPDKPNYFVLRKTADTATYNTVGGLDYSSPDVLDGGLKYTFWNDRIDGSAQGYCERCHGDARDIGLGAGDYHVASALCTDCHKHSGTSDSSFSADCGACHAYPPLWGSHQQHMVSDKMATLLSCASCHDSSGHVNDLSEVRFRASEPWVSGGSYSDPDETSRYTVLGGYNAIGLDYVSCDTLYCHSNAAPFDKANAYRQPVWGSTPADCSICHDGGGATTGLSGRHDSHTSNSTYDFDCEKCHAATAVGSVTINDAEQHLDMEKDVVFSAGGSYNAARLCASTYCHSDGAGGEGNTPVSWSDSGPLGCAGCHDGRIGDASQISSNAHLRLANEAWIRQYPCHYCHYDTVDLASDIKDYGKHVNESVDIVFNPKWNIPGEAPASYNATTMTCDNLYCHSDGTTLNPTVQDFPWDLNQHAECDSCHGHRGNCVDCHTADYQGWTAADQWKKATPMYENTGPGTDRANSHVRHLQTDFSCGNCHFNTVNEKCEDCHESMTDTPDAAMTEVGHIVPAYHVNKQKDVVFRDGGSYDPVTKTCSNTACHTGDDPVWGDSRNGAVLCLTCHGTTEADVDDYGAFNGTRAKINMTEWVTSGHGRETASGSYASGNPPADFPGNPCWYCHDKDVLHKDVTNPYRLKRHPQFERRFKKECVYCHMERKDEECWECHDTPESLTSGHQLSDLTGIDPDDSLPFTVDHAPFAGQDVSCLTSSCHLPQAESACRNCHDNPATGSGAVQLDDDVVRMRDDGKLYVVSELRVGMSAAPYAVDHIEFASGGSYSGVSCMATSADWPPTGCHSADVHIHNTGAGTWTVDQKEDIENQYVMMGVCLQCHDDDDNNRCNSCHSWSGAPEDNPYRLGYDPGTGFHSGSSKASSTHFGYKHFNDYRQSLNDVEFSAEVSRVELDQEYDVTHLVDSAQSWADDALVGKSLKFTSGPLVGEIRPIVTNSYNSVTFLGQLPSAIDAGTTFEVLATVWRGGKFCWDCHDPHGDDNIYMIQNQVALKTDGLYGKPLQRAPVDFRRAISGLDFARNDAPYDGICNVCHSDVEHYRNDYGDAHRSGRRCTSCHSHGFGEGHGSDQSCDSCHAQKPVPNHLGFGQSRDCIKCHDGVINQRTDILRQFRGQSHHVQGIEVTNKHCYKCHWEATEEGLINNDYHAGYDYMTHETASGGRSDLVVWGADGRPDRYELGVTATTFNAATIGTAEERANVADVSQHCLGCHSAQNSDTDVFGDCKTPRQYAWDRTSIAERYLDPATTNWGKYSATPGAARKVQTKAFSAHGNAVANEGGWSAIDGEDETLPNTRAGDQNVQCYDCHNSHGSYTTGITSSYPTFDNTYRGANLKETQAGKGGYSVTYRAGAVEDGAGVVNPMNPGASQCFDCHETRDAGSKPWGYFSTFGADKPIQSYRDSSRFGGGTTGHKTRFAYRAGKNTLGGHLKASAPLYNSADMPINGLCGGCHDPHGVSPSLGDDRTYAVPLLKGTWLTSPYKDDYPQVTSNQRASNFVNIDRKTFGTVDGSSQGQPLTLSEDAETFAGLCLRCHPKESLTDGIDKNTPFKSVDRIHETVKGWGNNAEHNFPCAKCHNPHSSGLGRLMRTNCLNVNHRGQVEAGGSPGYYSTGAGYAYPRTAYYSGGASWLPPCHESAPASGGNWNEQEWNTITPW
jgi:predicted CxxxxCH...CXXCH cytochrome family protein